MSELTCRLLPFVAADGPRQMAVDEVLLEGAAAGIASFRLYSWSVPTLSLGYFQPAAVRLSDPLLKQLPYVRRVSGGATLVHDREVTYALALPPGAPWQLRGDSWLRRMHGILRDALAALGVDTRLYATERKLGGVLCFLHHTPNDLLLNEAKIAGSAQRKMRGSLLQHGSILLAQSRHTPTLPGIAELTGITISPEDFCVVYTEQLARATGWLLQPDDWTETEDRRAAAIAAAKYGHASWNDKR